MAKRRLTRARTGRIPYSFVAIVLLSAVLMISSSLIGDEQNLLMNSGTTSSQSSGTMMGNAATALENNATLALLSSIAKTLQGGKVVNPTLSSLDQEVDSSVRTYVSSSFPLNLPAAGGMPACKNAVMMDPYEVCVVSWWVHVTFPTLHAEGLYPTVAAAGPSATFGPSAQDMTLSSVPVDRTPYPAVVGSLELMTYQSTSGTTAEATYPFVESPQTALGLLESSSNLYGATLSGPEGEFSRLAQYILTTVAELRALEGTGGGPYGTPTTVQDVMNTQDAKYAADLALLLTTLGAFRTYDPAAVDAFHAGSTQLDSLIKSYVTNGTIDGATLFLYLLQSMGGGPASASAQVGATLAQSIYSFTDRFTYDILHTFFGNYMVDPTLLEPVATWQDIWSQGQQAVETWAMARLNQYVNDYATWLGAVICQPPGGGNPPGQVSGTCQQSSIQAQSATADQSQIQGFGTVYCWYFTGTGVGLITWQGYYTLLPSTELKVNLKTANPIESLLMGNENQGSNGYAPNPFTFTTKLTVQASQYSNGNDQDSSTSHTFKYQLVDRSLLGEYAGGNSNDPGNVTLTKVVKDLSRSMADQQASVGDSGYVDTIANAMAAVGSSPSGLPGLSAGEVVNSSYSYLTGGVNTLYGTLGNGPTQFQSTEPGSATNWWISGAEHPGSIGSGPTLGPPYSLTDIARLASRLWYQTYYNLYYGMEGSVSPAFTFSTSSAEDGLWTSPGTTSGGGPPGLGGLTGADPNFGQDIQEADFNDIWNWIQSNTAWENIAYFDPTTYWAITSGFCDAGIYYDLPYYAALAYLDPQIIWDWILPLDQNFGSGAGDQTVGQWNPQYNNIAQSWSSIDSWTGGAHWGSYPFSNGAGDFLQTYVADPEIKPDTDSLASQWIPSIYQASREWTADMAGEQSLPFAPYLQRAMPYDYWNGPLAQAEADGGVEKTPSLVITKLQVLDQLGTGGGATVSVSQPKSTVHLVDPQDRTASMALAPFETTWNVLIAGEVKVTVQDPNPELYGGGKLNPTNLTVLLPLRANFPVTVLTPWPLQGNPLSPATDPVPLETRGLLGLVVGHPATVSYDYHPPGSNPKTWVFMPGDYVSPYLDKLLVGLHEAAVIGKNETAVEANVLSDLPDRASPGGPALSLALSQEVNLDGKAYSTAATKATAWTSLMNQISTSLKLTAGGTLPPVLALNFNTFFGDNMTSLNLQTEFANFQEGEGGTSTLARSDVLEATDAISGSAITGTVVYDPGNANMTFQSTWKTSGPSFSLSGSWTEGGVVSDLNLRGPAKAASGQTDAQAPALSQLFVPGGGYKAANAGLYLEAFPGSITTSSQAMSKAYANWMTPPNPSFDTYVTTEQYTSGYLFNCVDLTASCPLPSKAWTLGTSLEMPGGKLWASTSLSYAPSSGINTAGMEAFLLWEVSGNRVIAYSLNESNPDDMVLALMAQPEVGQVGAGWMSGTLLTPVYWNLTYGLGPFHGAPNALSNPPAAYTSPNLAAVEADLGGMALGGSPTAQVLLGGSQGGTYTFSGTFSET